MPVASLAVTFQHLVISELPFLPTSNFLFLIRQAIKKCSEIDIRNANSIITTGIKS